MSREIKFRAWMTKQNSWADCVVFFNDIIQTPDQIKRGMPQYDSRGSVTIRSEIKTDQYFEWSQSNGKSLVVEQYTGLKDKNGKEIYEGDIVSCYSLSGEYGALFVVKYGKLPDICGHEYCPCLQGFYLDEIDEYEEVDEDGDMEVIGNIHENPELLEGKNEKI